MRIVSYRDYVMFRTPFSEKFDLLQRFRGVGECVTTYNHPVDFADASLISRETRDYLPLSLSTDEATPVIINGKWIGANHGFSGAVTLCLSGHDKTIEDVGSVWQDLEGTKWTLLYIGEDTLTFISENIGKSKEEYVFKEKIASRLTFLENGEHKSDILADGESFKSPLQPTIRHIKRKTLAYTDGKARVVNREMSCEYAEIHEEYEIINPATVAEALYKNRPKGGYKTTPYAVLGEPMLLVRMIYRIENDGSVLCDFTYQRLSNVHFSRCMGAMFQEKLNTFGGGIYRYIPKVLPVDTAEGIFDFSNPVNTWGDSFPADKQVTSEYWEKPASPPDRIVDYFRDNNGDDRVGFACGYLPVYDCVPEVRTKCLGSAMHLINTRKGYPYFMEGDIDSARGVAYKKYFNTPIKKASFYKVCYNEKMYLYMDFFEEKTLKIPITGTACLIEKSDGISYKIENGFILASGFCGYAVFVCE